MLDSAHHRQTPPFKFFLFLTVAFIILIGLALLHFFPIPKFDEAKERLTGQCSGRPCPAEILDLSNWKITLPKKADGKFEDPLEVAQPKLAKYSDPPWFESLNTSQGVVFRAPVNGIVTSGSDYPRSELREMTKGGTRDAFWSTKSGVHTLFLDQAITAVPQEKPDVVAGQIHGDDDDLLVIRLEYPTLYITRSKSNVFTLDENYALGKRFTVKFVAKDGKIMVYYNNYAAPVYTLDKKVDEAYFKAGVYTQSNCETENLPSLCNSNNYGEVIIYKIEMTHSK